VHDAFLVRGRESGADVARDGQRFVGGEAADAAQQRREVFTVDVLHRDEDVMVDLDDVVKPADVRMRDLAAGAGLTIEPRARVVRRAETLGKELQRDGLAEPEIVGAIDLAHSAAPEHGDDAIAAAEDETGAEPCGRSGIAGLQDDGRRIAAERAVVVHGIRHGR